MERFMFLTRSSASGLTFVTILFEISPSSKKRAHGKRQGRLQNGQIENARLKPSYTLLSWQFGRKNKLTTELRGKG
jgi:hypothetical protein